MRSNGDATLATRVWGYSQAILGPHVLLRSKHVLNLNLHEQPLCGRSTGNHATTAVLNLPKFSACGSIFNTTAVLESIN